MVGVGACDKGYGHLAGGRVGICGRGLGHVAGCGVMWQGVEVCHKG